jgi:hypothetical protein
LSHALAHALVPLQVRAEMRHRAEEALLHASSDAEAAAAAAAAEAAARAQQQAEEEALHMEARRAKLQREGARQAALDQRAEADGARAFPSCMRSVLTEILPIPRLFLSRNIEDANARGQPRRLPRLRPAWRRRRRGAPGRPPPRRPLPRRGRKRWPSR